MMTHGTPGRRPRNACFWCRRRALLTRFQTPTDPPLTMLVTSPITIFSTASDTHAPKPRRDGTIRASAAQRTDRLSVTAGEGRYVSVRAVGAARERILAASRRIEAERTCPPTVHQHVGDLMRRVAPPKPQ